MPAITLDEAFFAALRDIAERAGAAILTHYAARESVEVRRKEDASPVTAADEEAEALILPMLGELTPGLPVVAEEASAAGHWPDVSGGIFWLVDPLDGTREFINGNGEFTVNIALVKDGQPLAGVVHAPALGRTWVGGAGHAAVAETGAPMRHIAARPPPPEGLTVVASRRHGSSEALDRFLAGLPVARQVSAGSSLKFCLVAGGEADLYPRFGPTMEWDTAAGHAVLAAAGGRVETLEGEPLLYGKPDYRNPQFVAYGKS